MYSLRSIHLGMRQYWRDFNALEAYARFSPYQEAEEGYLRDSGGTGFWHEIYVIRGGMKAIDTEGPGNAPIGFARFAPTRRARGQMFLARKRAGRPGTPAAVVPESELYRTG